MPKFTHWKMGARALSARAGLLRSMILVLACALGLLALRWTAALTLPLICATILTLLLSPVVEALQRRNVSGALAAALVVLLPSMLLAGGAALAVPSFLSWASEIAATVSRFAALLEPPASHGTASDATVHWLVSGVRAIDTEVGLWTAHQAPPLMLTAVSVVMLTFFLLLGQRSLLAGVLRALNHRRSQARVLGFLRQARDDIASYLIVMTAMNVLLAIATGAVLWALGFTNPAVWSALVALLLFIPYLGPMAVALLLLAGLPDFNVSAIQMIAPSLSFLALHAIEANVISPWAMGHRLQVGRPALIVAVIVGGWTWGVIGGVLAVPLLIVGRAALRRTRGHALAKALLAEEDGDAPNLGTTSSEVISPRLKSALWLAHDTHRTSGRASMYE